MIKYPGMLSLDELRQALWQNIEQLEEMGVKYVKDCKLFLPIVDEHGDPRALREPDGSRPTHWTSRAYKSAASDYKL